MNYISHWEPADERYAQDFLKWREGSGRTVELFDIQVGSKRRDGIGRAMVYKLLRELPRGTNLVWAITRTTNQIAQEFYEDLGFRVVGVLRNFYKDQGLDGVDAIVFGRDI